MKHTVVLTSAFPSIALELLSQEFDVIAHPVPGRKSEEELIELLAEADAAITVLTDPITRRILSSNPNLRIIANYAVGTDNIDLEAARALGIRITNTPGVLTDATADAAIALMLSVTRRVVEGDRMIRDGGFHGWEPLMLLGTSLQHKRLGIIGMGRIGFAVATRARAFGMEIVYSGRSAHPDSEALHASSRVTLEELLRTSDVISLHVPLSGETRHLIDARALARMKPGSYLINTSRGPLIDEEALADALESGRLRGAGLDVYEHEPEVHPRLLPLTNVVLLPHLGSATEEARREMARLAATDVRTFFGSGQVRNQVV